MRYYKCLDCRRLKMHSYRTEKGLLYHICDACLYVITEEEYDYIMWGALEEALEEV